MRIYFVPPTDIAEIVFFFLFPSPPSSPSPLPSSFLHFPFIFLSVFFIYLCNGNHDNQIKFHTKWGKLSISWNSICYNFSTLYLLKILLSNIKYSASHHLPINPDFFNIWKASSLNHYDWILFALGSFNNTCPLRALQESKFITVWNIVNAYEQLRLLC